MANFGFYSVDKELNDNRFIDLSIYLFIYLSNFLIGLGAVIQSDLEELT